MFREVRARADRLRDTLVDAQRRVARVRDEVSRNIQRARSEAEQTARSLGLPVDEGKGKVIDVGEHQSPLRRVGNAVAAMLLATLIAGSLLSFSSFLFQFLLATLIAGRILGLRLDLGTAGVT